MSRHWTDEALWRYVDGRLDPRDATELERDVAQDAQLRIRLAELARTDRWLSESMPVDEPPKTLMAGFHQRLAAGIDATSPSIGWLGWIRSGISSAIQTFTARDEAQDRRRRSSRLATSLTATLVLFILLGFVAVTSLDDPSPISVPGFGAPVGNDSPAESERGGVRSIADLRTGVSHDLDLDHFYYLDGIGLTPLGPKGYAAVGVGESFDGASTFESEVSLAKPVVRRSGQLEVELRSLYSDGKSIRVDLTARYPRRAGDESEASRDAVLTLRTDDEVWLLDRRAGNGQLVPFENWDTALSKWGKPLVQLSTALPERIERIELVVTTLNQVEAASSERPEESNSSFVVESEVRFPLRLAWVAQGDLAERRAKRSDQTIERWGVPVQLVAWYRDPSRVAVLLNMRPANQVDFVAPAGRAPPWSMHVSKVTRDSLEAYPGQLTLRTLQRVPVPTWVEADRDPVSQFVHALIVQRVIRRPRTVQLDSEHMWIVDDDPPPSTYGYDRPPSSSLGIYTVEFQPETGELAGPIHFEIETLALFVDAFVSADDGAEGSAEIAHVPLTLPPRSDEVCCAMESLPARDIHPVRLDFHLESVHVQVDRIAHTTGHPETSALILNYSVRDIAPGFDLTGLTFGQLEPIGGRRMPLLGTRIGGTNTCAPGLGGIGRGQSVFFFTPQSHPFRLCAMKPQFQVTGPWRFVLGD